MLIKECGRAPCWEGNPVAVRQRFEQFHRNTGMRRSELYSLEWDRVDLERRQLHLLKTKNGTARVVILTEAAVNALKEL